jgi:hypothetical protein
MTDFTLDIGPNGTGALLVGGVDIAKAVTGATLTIRPGHPPRLAVDLAAPDGARIAVEGSDVEIREDTAAALTALGWARDINTPTVRQAIASLLADYLPARGVEPEKPTGLIFALLDRASAGLPLEESS